MDTLPLMINGLPGHVARVMAEAALKDPRFDLVAYSLTGPEIDDDTLSVSGRDIRLVRPAERKDLVASIRAEHPFFMVVDFTHPTAVNDNARFYTENRIPFVMGTTGGDRQALEETVKQADTPAVIAPNMAKQIVGLQAMMDYAAKTFPGLFKDYALTVKESHQQGKADTSGTAKAMVGYFQNLGVDFSLDAIEKIRDPDTQKNEWQIPEEHLEGHGWHTYTLSAKDGSSLFEITHNINGRDIYVAGTFDAVIFLHQKLHDTDSGQRLYTMIDVLTASG